MGVTSLLWGKALTLQRSSTLMLDGPLEPVAAALPRGLDPVVTGPGRARFEVGIVRYGVGRGLTRPAWALALGLGVRTRGLGMAFLSTHIWTTTAESAEALRRLNLNAYHRPKLTVDDLGHPGLGTHRVAEDGEPVVDLRGRLSLLRLPCPPAPATATVYTAHPSGLQVRTFGVAGVVGFAARPARRCRFFPSDFWTLTPAGAAKAVALPPDGIGARPQLGMQLWGQGLELHGPSRPVP